MTAEAALVDTVLSLVMRAMRDKGPGAALICIVMGRDSTATIGYGDPLAFRRGLHAALRGNRSPACLRTLSGLRSSGPRAQGRARGIRRASRDAEGR